MIQIDNHKYKRFESNVNHKGKWLSIFLFGLESTFRSKLAKVIIAGAWLNAIIKSVLFILFTQGQLDVELLETQGPRFFSKTILDIGEWQFLWLALLLSTVGAGLISNDLKKGAYQLYFARPIKLKDYVIGKCLTVFFYSFIILWLPICLFCIHCFLFSGYGASPNWQVVRNDITILNVLLIFVYLLSISVSIIFLILLLSSLTQKAKFATLTFISIFLVGEVLAQVSVQIISLKWLQCFSYLANINILGRGILSLKLEYNTEFYIAGMILSFLLITCVYILIKRLKKIMIIGIL